MTIPRATVRLQFNRGFTFDAAVAIVPYFAALGVSHIYASPILRATPGSTHGYDVTDPTAVNPELGGEPGLLRLSAALKQHGMGLLLDIVPNHMAATAENPWWWDVLRLGRASPTADFFDIDWEDSDPKIRGKVLLPTLGDDLDACLGRGELKVARADNGDPVLHYFDNRFPLDPRSITADTLPPAPDDLRRLLAAQHYVLAHWRDAPTRINWRRFFDINQLVALRMDRPEVFDAYHRLTLDLVRDGIVDGLRVDHVDGLADPAAYLRRLRARLQALEREAPHYLIVEKILESDERLSDRWPIDGTTGYDFMDQVSAVLHDPRGELVLSDLWRSASGDARSFHDLARDARREIVERLFPKPLDRLLVLLSSEHGAASRRALVELLASFNRYRLYGDEAGFSETDLALLQEAERDAAARLDPAEAGALHALTTNLASPPAGEARRKFQQLSATLTAKAVEDTSFYRYSRLLSRNEVGSDPGRLAMAPEAFHRTAQQRAEHFPAAMLATATHDHKRGEDARARLAVLTELPEEWTARVEVWFARFPEPAPTIQLATYQSLVGAWPLQFDRRSAEECDALRKRLAEWLVKALREAKQQTSWSDPDEDFERRCLDFLGRLFAADDFMAETEAFVTRVAPAGALNGVSQTILRLTAPGVPDLYQGTEFWDFSLVDPDNRRPVDFAARATALQEAPEVKALMPFWRDGRIKQRLIAVLLDFRRRHPHLFAAGGYRPLSISGSQSAHLIAFARETDGEAMVVVVPRCVARAVVSDKPGISTGFWKDTEVALPDGLIGREAVDILQPRRVSLRRQITASDLLADLPWAVLHIPAR